MVRPAGRTDLVVQVHYRIVGHLTLCFITHYCESLMTKALRDKKMILDSRQKRSRLFKPAAFFNSAKLSIRLGLYFSFVENFFNHAMIS